MVKERDIAGISGKDEEHGHDNLFSLLIFNSNLCECACEVNFQKQINHERVDL